MTRALRVVTRCMGSMSEWIAVHRKHQVSAPSPSDAAPVHEEGENIVKQAAPDASRPPEDRGWLPPVIVGALLVWVTIITAGAVHRLHRMHVRAGDAARQVGTAVREQAHHAAELMPVRYISCLSSFANG